jgi:nitrate/TMAO reductase-like tetraheme cytochrome c subunit
LKSRSRKRLIWWGVILAMLSLVAVAALVVTAQPSFCQTCHIMKTRHVSWERSDHHPEADCLDCHAEPGLWGEIKAHVNGARYVYVLFTGVPEVILRAEVPVGTCIQCHEVNEIDDDVDGVDVAHQAHQSAKVTCEACHRGFHDDIGGGRMNASLEVCVECHPPSILIGSDQLEMPSASASPWSVDGAR